MNFALLQQPSIMSMSSRVELGLGFPGNVDVLMQEAVESDNCCKGALPSSWPTPSPSSKALLHSRHGEMDMRDGQWRAPDNLVNALPLLGMRPWAEQLKAGTPLIAEYCHGSSTTVSCAPQAKDFVHHYTSHNHSFHGGSLILDAARGELVDASKMTQREILEAKALAASKSHSEAERRRRQRINGHLTTLRTLLPISTKTDKASLLAEVIEQVKTLKRQASEIYGSSSFPTDHDELTVEKVPSSAEGRMLIRASFCCDDRPELISHLKDTLETLKLTTLKAEISTLGGRIKNVFILKEDTCGQEQEQEQDTFMRRLEEALKTVMEASSSSSGELSPSFSNKRQRAPGCST